MAQQITWTDKTGVPIGGSESENWTEASVTELKSKFNNNATEITTNATDIATLEGISGAVPFHYQFESSTAASSPAVGYFRLNNAKPDLTTQIHVNSTDDNIDVHDVLATLTNDHYIYIQNRQTKTLSSVFKVSTASDFTTWFTFGVVYVSGASTAYTADDLFVFSPVFTPLTTAGTGTVTSATPGTGLYLEAGSTTVNPTFGIESHAGTAGSIGTIHTEADKIGVDLGITSTTAAAGDHTHGTLSTGNGLTGANYDGSSSPAPWALGTPSTITDSTTNATTASSHTHELQVTESFIVALSDETTDLTTGVEKATIRMPYAFTLTGVRASVTTAPTGSVITVDIDSGISSILTTKLTIDATEFTSETAATPPVIGTTSLADDAAISFDIDTVGSTITGAGLKVTLIGYKT